MDTRTVNSCSFQYKIFETDARQFDYAKQDFFSESETSIILSKCKCKSEKSNRQNKS